MSVHHVTEADVCKRAFDHPCPDCGADAKVRCRILTPNKTAHKKTKVDVRLKPCPGRVQVAWREMRAEGVV
jgi:hypothetical protein